jgi:streptomycin 6-kinase
MLDPEIVLDDAARERLISRFGDGARPWCAGLPELVERCCVRWDLRLEQAQSGSTSRVYLGSRGDGAEVVLKVTPEPPMARAEATALRAWAASPHAVTLLDADPEDGALVLERLRPGTKLWDAGGIPPARELAELLTSLRAPATGDLTGPLPTLSQRVDFIFNLIGKRLASPRVAALVRPELVTVAHQRARDLAGGGPTALVHGDLHFANILVAEPPRGLVAIDPRPCLGDPTFDAVDWALAPAHRTAPSQLDQRIAGICALVPHLDPGRLRSWCQASAVIIVVQRLHRRPADETIPPLLELAAR